MGEPDPHVRSVRARDGAERPFDPGRIEQAIAQAQQAAGKPDAAAARRVTEQVCKRLADAPSPVGVEAIQDLVEKCLVESGQAEVAKAYILYRQRRQDLRQTKATLGVADDLKLSVNAATVLRHRYLRRDEEGHIAERPSELFGRVAHAVAEADRLYTDADADASAERFYRMMCDKDFLPNSPTFMNAGTKLGQLSGCFVLPVGDSLPEIFRALGHMALIHQSGGGTGFSFSKIRPRGDVVRSTGGVASGPVSFMSVFDASTEVIKQGGRRRGANMAVLHVSHPDVQEFITCKLGGSAARNFNISVAVTDAFMQAAKDGGAHDLVNPRTGKTAGTVPARDLFELIAVSAWQCGDPGLIFIDEVQRHNPTPALGPIEATNPCGEQPLLPYESCILGSINLSRMVDGDQIDWEHLARTVRAGVHFLDNVVDVNVYPVEEIRCATLASRKVGLGVMGFAEMLIRLGIPYDSSEALRAAEEVMKFITQTAESASAQLAERRGSFPNFAKSIWPQRGYRHMRNAALTTVAPTGTISIVADTPSGIEPLFALSFLRNVLGGTQLFEENKLFRQAAESCGIYSRGLMAEVARRQGVRGISSVPESMQRLFGTALEIDPEWHVRMQAAFQRHTHSAVSKTVNLPHEATHEDVKRAFWLAYKLKCKGITVFRYGSRQQQVLESHFQSLEGLPEFPSEYDGSCRSCVT